MTGKKTNQYRVFACLLFLLLLLVGGDRLLRGRSPEKTQPVPKTEQRICFGADGVSIEAAGAELLGRELVITGNGPYTLQGSLVGLGLHVMSKGETVLIFDGLELSNPEGIVLLAERKCDLHIILRDNTHNVLRSGSERELLAEKEASGAALETKGDLTLSGSGELRIEGYLNNAVRCRQNLAVEAGVRIDLLAANKGIRSNVLSFEDTRCSLVCGDEGIYAETELHILGGTLDAETAGSCLKADGPARIDGCSLHLNTQTGDGIRAGGAVELSGTEIVMSAADDCIRGDGDIRINGGSLSLNTQTGDGIQADGAVELSDAKIEMEVPDDGIRSIGPVRMKGGSLLLKSRDGDGIWTEGEVQLSGELLAVDVLEDAIHSGSGIELACEKTKISAGGDGLQVTGRENASGQTIRLLSGEVLISTYALPIRTEGRCSLAEGVSFLASGISEKKERLPIDSTQTLYQERADGGKRDVLRLCQKSKTLLSMEAAYGYNLVSYSLPGFDKADGLNLKIG